MGAFLPPVLLRNTVTQLGPDACGSVVVTGSHGGLIAAYLAATGGVHAGDGASLTRLPVLAERGIPAGVVDYRSARIGDARSMWKTGVISACNALATLRGMRTGTTVRDAAERLGSL